MRAPLALGVAFALALAVSGAQAADSTAFAASGAEPSGGGLSYTVNEVNTS
jgi:hypothetical protein